MDYILYKTFFHNKMKWLVTIVIFVIFSFYNIYRKTLIYSFSIEESLLTSIDDRIIMLIVFSVLPLLITTSSLNFNTWDAVLLSKIGNRNKWAIKKLTSMGIASMAVILVYYISFFFIGKILGVPNLSSWSNSTFYVTNIINPDSFDTSGNPFIGFLNVDVSINNVIAYSYFLLVIRTIFLAFTVYLIYIFVGNLGVGILMAVFLSWLEIYSYSFCVNFVHVRFILPHEHSLATFINNARPHVVFSILYWTILLTTLSTLCVLFSDRMIEKYMCDYRKNNREGEYV